MSRYTENALAESSDSGGAVDEAAASPKTMTLSGVAGAAGPSDIPAADGFDLDTGKPRRTALNQGTMLIILVLVIAAGVIYTLRATLGEIEAAPGSRAAEDKVDRALARIAMRSAATTQEEIGKMFGDVDMIIAMFTSDLTRHQVPFDYVQRNPFIVTVSGGAAEDVEEDTGDSWGERLAQLNEEFGRLNLHTIITGPTNVAMVDGDMVLENQRLGSFTVKKIRKLAVELEAEGRMFTLTMRSRS